MNLTDSIGLAFFTIIFTFLTNILFKHLQDKFDFMADTKKFKRDYYFKQLTELNLELYAIIAQSEFLRYFHDLKNRGTIKEIPFLESKQNKTVQTRDMITGEILQQTEEVIATSISKFNKMELVENIINKKQYASQKLIKLAVAYRYCHEFYLKDDIVPEQLKKFQEEELRLIYDIVITVVSETNAKLKFCKMDYIESEIKTGTMQSDVFEPPTI
ncbi:hypothetical protein ABW02_06885 [Niallia circulans]|uniref:Uncharacterized protein n=1 Tax=Niallia circulans TaxID=1397 RepID=A0A0J1IMQ9_NIACI|nr:hypothetical protein [Niallia circulans]KLV27239.1 hypothetical protein ABW02_06885 [Niallia circulans]